MTAKKSSNTYTNSILSRRKKTDDLIVAKVETLIAQPLMGVERVGIRGRLLIIPDVSLMVVYFFDGSTIRILRVLHQKQQYPHSN